MAAKGAGVPDGLPVQLEVGVWAFMVCLSGLSFWAGLFLLVRQGRMISRLATGNPGHDPFLAEFHQCRPGT